MKRRGAWGVAVGALALLGGCVGASVKPDAVKQVKTVAIVSISNKDMLPGASQTNYGGAYRAQMESIYDSLADKLGGAGFVVVKRADLVANEKFADAYQRLTHVDLAGQPAAFVEKSGHFNLADQAQRAQLLDALAVDAVAMVDITYTAGNASGVQMGGHGKMTRFPQASVDFSLYDRALPGAIWQDWRCMGHWASQGIEDDSGNRTNKTPGPIFLEAANTSFNKLVARFQEAKNAPEKK